MADTALLMTALYPLCIRQTCKDKLLSDPIYGHFIRATKAIPIKRKQDYQNKKVDNSQAFDAVYTELANEDNDCIVGMYPEGISRYKPSLSPFRTGLARIAINFILKYPHKSVNIIPVGLNYLHREKFRSSVNVRIGKPILLNSEMIKEKVNAMELDLSSDQIYKIGKDITNELRKRFDNLVISSPNWKMLKLAHLARGIAFPESSSPKQTFLTHYIDLGRQFNEIFRDESNDEMVSKCYHKLNEYCELLWMNGLKDYRVLQMSKCQRNHNVNSRIWRNCRLSLWLLYRFGRGISLFALSLPAIISSSPIYILWQYLRRMRIQRGIEVNYDEVAVNKMTAFSPFGVPILCLFYGCIITNRYEWRKGAMFGTLYPFILWISVRLWQNGFASMRNAYSLLKMLFLSREKENNLIECRRNVSDLVLRVVGKYEIGYDDKIMSEEDKAKAPSTMKSNMNCVRRHLTGRINDDWNDTIRFYDVPMDEFHIHNS